MSLYEELLDFIENRMRMSHIYQPVMLITLLENDGQAPVRTIAERFASMDESQIEYYAQITKNMPGRVLSANHGIVEVEKDGRQIRGYRLKGFEALTAAERQRLVRVCRAKYEAYLDQRGGQVFRHRALAKGYISGTLKYEVMKRARYRCELCGISATEKALEVDHILPRNKGGGDELTNLQALCFTCNARKRDHDDTDFRGNRALYELRESGCVFCSSQQDHDIVHETELAIVLRDRFPVTPGHHLVIPKRHEPDWFELTEGELAQCSLLMKEFRRRLSQEDPSIRGFNMGVNSGMVAGQTVMHAHAHLIPRRAGDYENPRGGVRGVIPSRQSY